ERLIARLNPKQATVGEDLARRQERRQALLQNLVEHKGLRAQLRSGSLLTGQLYVALDFFPDAPPAKLDWSREPTVFPVVPSTVPDLEAKITGILTKLDHLPIEALGDDARNVLASVDATLQSARALVDRANDQVVPGLDSTLAGLRTVLATADGVLKTELSTTLAEANATLVKLRGAIGTADVLLKNTDASLLGQNAPMQQDL